MDDFTHRKIWCDPQPLHKISSVSFPPPLGRTGRGEDKIYEDTRCQNSQ